MLLAWTGALDRTAQAHTDELLKRALLTFAVARGLDGVISMAQGIEIAVQPAGLGVTFSAGEILDPINDLVEQFSWIALAAAASLGLQGLLLRISAWWWLSLGVTLVLGAVLLAEVSRSRAAESPLKRPMYRASTPRALGGLAVLLLLLRFAMPLAAAANWWVSERFLRDDQEHAVAILEQTGAEIGQLGDAAGDQATA